MKKEELIKKLEEKIDLLKGVEKAFAKIGDGKQADIYFWQRFELQYVLEDIKNLED